MTRELLSQLNPTLIANIQRLSNSTNINYLRKLRKVPNLIKFHSTLSEIRFGILLTQQFSNIRYDKQINTVKPDWEIYSNNEKIIFEVLKFTPSENVLKQNLENINAAMVIKTFSFNTGRLYHRYHSVRNKLKDKYLDLVKKDGYKYIIGIDARSEDTGLISYEEFYNFFIGNNDGCFFTEPRFNYVDGIAFLCHFAGEHYYLKNPNSNYNINSQNTAIMRNIFL